MEFVILKRKTREEWKRILRSNDLLTEWTAMVLIIRINYADQMGNGVVFRSSRLTNLAFWSVRVTTLTYDFHPSGNNRLVIRLLFER